MAKTITWRGAARGGSLYSHDTLDNNFDALAHFSGDWSAGTYTVNEVVRHNGATWVCVVASTTVEPGTAFAWVLLGTLGAGGGMYLSAPASGLGSIGAGYTPIEAYDTIDPAPLGVSFDPALGLFRLEYPGIWSVEFEFAFGFDDSNQGRQTNFQLYDVDAATSLGVVPFYIGRNQEGGNFSVQFRFIVNPADEQNALRLEIGGGSTFTVTSVDACSLDATHITPRYQ